MRSSITVYPVLRGDRHLVSVGIAAILLCVAFCTADAQTLSASASVSPARVAVGGTVTYTLTIRGGNSVNATAPQGRDGLRLRSPQPTLDVRSSINGRTERRLAWSYEAVRAGTGTISAARIEVDRATLEVDAARVTITQGSAQTPSPQPDRPASSSDIFVRAEPSIRSAVVGQQIVVDYVLYFLPHLQPRQTAPIGTWDAPGFWREEMDIPTAYPRPVTLGGISYEAVTIRRMALFPTRSGTLSLAPMKFSVDLLRTSTTYDDDPFAPFFSPFASKFEEEQVEASVLDLEVTRLPAGAPDTFDGAVGTFELTSEIDQTTVRVGDPIQMRVSLSGTGNIATIAAPKLDLPTGFDVYDPSEEQQSQKSGEPLRGVKTFTYTIVPQGGGQFDVPPVVWTYFDPSDGTFKSLRSDAYSVEVAGPPIADAEAADPSDPNQPAPVMTEADWGRGEPSPAVLWALLGGGAALPLLLALGIVVARVRRDRINALPEVKHVADRVPTIENLRDTSGPDFYSDLERSLRCALEEKLGVPRGTARSDISDALAARGTESAVAAEVASILRETEQAQYAPGLEKTEHRSELAGRAEAVLRQLGTRPQRRHLRSLFSRKKAAA